MHPIGSHYGQAANTRGFWHSLIWGCVGTIAIFVLAIALDQQVPPYIFPLLYTLLMYTLTGFLQGQLLQAQFANGGRRASYWKAIGIGALCLVGVVIAWVCFVLIIMAINPDLLPE